MSKHRSANFSDTLANLVGEVVADARHKLIDEAWFGRPAQNAIPNFYESLWERYGYPSDPARPEQAPEIER